MTAAKDFTGQKYNRLTFVRHTNKKYRKEIIWELICDCGTTINARSHAVLIGSITRCSRQCKLNKYKGKDYTGQKYGKLTFIKPSKKKGKKKEILWELKCECGNTCYRAPYTIIKKLYCSCGCTSPSRKFTAWESSARIVWHGCYKDADWQTFLHLSQLPCHYCGLPPQLIRNAANSWKCGGDKVSDYQVKEGNFTYNGLDRIDSNQGHTNNNIVTCCITCNIMKRDMSVNDFLSHIKRIASHNT